MSAVFRGTNEELAKLTRDALGKSREQNETVRMAERVVLSRAVEFADAHTLFYAGESDEDAEHLDAVEQTLLAAIAALRAAEAAA